MNNNTQNNVATTVASSSAEKLESIINNGKAVNTRTGRRGRPSKLNPYADAVRILLNEEKMTFKAAASFLAQRGINVNPVTIQSFAKKNNLFNKEL